MELLTAYIPRDRLAALAQDKALPDRTQGAVLFADISGSTPLAEALVSQYGPRRGADEFTVWLNQVYDVLIAAVHGYGGSVIAFSGDAITCWFDRDDGQQAIACALALQQEMDRFAVRETPGEGLAVKVGIACGPVRRFVVGDLLIQVFDVLAGRLMDTMDRATHLAERREVIVSPALLDRFADQLAIVERRLDDETGQRFGVISGFFEAAQAIPTRSTPSMLSAWPSVDQMRPWLLPPVYERLASGQGRFLAELLPVVALFCRFVGLDYDRDEDAGLKLDAYIRWAQKVLHGYDGYIFQLTMGDKGSNWLAVLGAPVVHDDDATRAIAAALELCSLPPELSYITGVRIGINRGRARAGDYGSSERHIYSVLGDEINVAARLMQKAQAGQVLVSRSVFDAASLHFGFDYLGTASLKGKGFPIGLFAALGRLTPRVSPFTRTLVGRERELAQMASVLDAVLSGEGRVLCLEGDAGVGKSHLLAELARLADRKGFRTVRGAGQSISRELFAPWRQVFLALLELPEERAQGAVDLVTQQIAHVQTVIGATNPDWRVHLPLLGDLLGLPIQDTPITRAFGPQERQAALLALAVDILREMAHAQPLLVLVDDAQWMDEPSRRLTAALRTAVDRAPLLLSLAYRPAAGEAQPLFPELALLPGYQLVHLVELSEQSLAQLVADRLQGELSSLALALVAALTQRNPYFAETLIDDLRESGKLVCRDDATWDLSPALFGTLLAANCLERVNGEWVLCEQSPLTAAAVDVPTSIAAVVLSRLGRVDPEQLMALKVASVVGPEFELRVLADAHPDGPGEKRLARQMAALGRQDFVWLTKTRPQPVYAFRHHVVQEVVYQSLPQSQQGELHQAVGQAVERMRPGDVERLAYHYYRSPARGKALFYLDQAAEKTQREYANQTALNYYNQALELEKSDRRYVGKAQVLHILGRREQEAEALQAVHKPSAGLAFDVGYLWGQYFEATGQFEEAQSRAEQAMQAAQASGDLGNRVRCLVQLGLISRRRGQFEAAVVHLQQAIQQAPSAYTRAQVLSELGTVYREQGEFGQARQYYRKALAQSRESGNLLQRAQAWDNLGTVAFRRRAFDRAGRYHQRAVRLRQRISDRAGEGTSIYNLGLACIGQGDYDRAVELLRAALDIQRATQNRWEQINVLMALGGLYIEVGNLQQAQAQSQESLRLCREIGDQAGEMYVLGNLSLILRQQGELAAAKETLMASMDLADKQSNQEAKAMCLSHLAVISARRNQWAKAEELAEAALSLRAKLGLDALTTADRATWALACMGQGKVDAAVEHADKALSILRACRGEGPEFPHHDSFFCYQVFAQAGQEEKALAALRLAYELLMDRAAKIADPATCQCFLEHTPIHRQIATEARQKGLAPLESASGSAGSTDASSYGTGPICS